MLQAQTFRSIAGIDADQWNACFPRDPETHAYLRAVEEAALPGFDWRYFVVTDGDALVAAAPAFFTAYPLEPHWARRPSALSKRCDGYFPIC